MKTKICKMCNFEKEIEQFRMKKQGNKYYVYSYCKECERQIKKKYRSYNIKAKESDIRYRQKHKEEIKVRSKKYRLKNYDKLKEKYGKEYRDKWKKEHQEKLKQYSKNDLQRIKSDPLKMFKRQARDAIRNGFRRKGFSKTTKTEKLLGCDYNLFIKHLLETFKLNYGYDYDWKEPIHIDHIIPLKNAKTEQEVIELSHYTNLQLLKVQDNLQKGSKLNYKIVYNSKEF